MIKILLKTVESVDKGLEIIAYNFHVNAKVLCIYHVVRLGLNPRKGKM